MMKIKIEYRLHVTESFPLIQIRNLRGSGTSGEFQFFPILASGPEIAALPLDDIIVLTWFHLFIYLFTHLGEIKILTISCI